MEDRNTLPETGFMRLPEVLRFIPVARSTWWAGVKSGKFPQSEVATVWWTVYYCIITLKEYRYVNQTSSTLST